MRLVLLEREAGQKLPSLGPLPPLPSHFATYLSDASRSSRPLPSITSCTPSAMQQEGCGSGVCAAQSAQRRQSKPSAPLERPDPHPPATAAAIAGSVVCCPLPPTAAPASHPTAAASPPPSPIPQPWPPTCTPATQARTADEPLVVVADKVHALLVVEPPDKPKHRSVRVHRQAQLLREGGRAS